MGYRPDDRGSISSMGNRFFLYPTVSRPVLGLNRSPKPMATWLGGLSPGVKWPGPEANHWSPSSAKVKKVELYLHTILPSS
jgi:hypothetical protein